MHVFIDNWPALVMAGVGIGALGLILGSWWMISKDESCDDITTELEKINDRLEELARILEKRNGDAR